MDLDTIAAVFKFVIMADRFGWQSPLLTHRHKPNAEFICQGSTNQKPPRFDAHNLVYLLIHIAHIQFVHHRFQPCWILKQGRDVTKLHAVSRIMWHGTDQRFNRHHLPRTETDAILLSESNLNPIWRISIG